MIHCKHGGYEDCPYCALETAKAENIALHEKIAFLESREVCAAAHENVETCGYCQRDNLAKALKRYASHDVECGYFKPCKCGLDDVLTVCGCIKS